MNFDCRPKNSHLIDDLMPAKNCGRSCPYYKLCQEERERERFDNLYENFGYRTKENNCT